MLEELFTLNAYTAKLRMMTLTLALTLSSISALASNNSCGAALSGEIDRSHYILTNETAEIFELNVPYKKLTPKPNLALNYYDMVDFTGKFMVHISRYGNVEVLLYPNYRFTATGLYGINMDRLAGAALPPQEGFYIVFKELPADFANKVKLYANALNLDSRYALTCTTAACATLRELQVNPLQRTRVSAQSLLRDLIYLQRNESDSIETYYLGHNVQDAIKGLKSDRVSDVMDLTTKWTVMTGAISALIALAQSQL